MIWYPARALADKAEVSAGAVCRRLQIHQTKFRRGFTFMQADAAAVAFGFHPVEVWSDWALDDNDIDCRGCGTTFMPTKDGQVYCHYRCGNAHRARGKRAKVAA